MEILIPVWQANEVAQIAANELRALDGVTVAFLDDNYDKDFAEEIEQQLGAIYGALVKRLIKPNGSAPSPIALLEEAAQCRVAVVGIAL